MSRNLFKSLLALVMLSGSAETFAQFIVNNGISVTNQSGLVTNGEWTNISGSLLVNKGTITTSEAFTNDGTLDASSTGGFVLNYASNKTFKPGGTSIAFLSKKGNGNVQVSGTIVLRDSLVLTGGIITLASATDTIGFMPNAVIVTGANSFITGLVSHRGTGDKVFPLGKDGLSLPLKLYKTNASRITAEVINKPAGLTPGPGVDSLAALPYAWKVAEKVATDTAAYVEIGYPSNLTGNNNLIVARQTGSQLTGMGARSITTAGGVTRIRSYSRGLKGVFTAAYGFANNPVVDSLALVALFQSTNGAAWTSKTNWMSGQVETWQGVTFAGQTITAINLPSNNLSGTIPDQLIDIVGLQTLNVSGNQITAVPDFTLSEEILSLNVSDNKLNFETLEPNAAMTGFVYAPQKSLASASEVLLEVSTPYTLNIDAGGAATTYTWKRNGTQVSQGVNPLLTLQSVNRTNMGDYTLEATNSVLPALTLTTGAQRVLAYATVSGQFVKNETEPITAGELRLYKVQSGAFEPVDTVFVNATGGFEFEKVILDDYLLRAYADTLVFEKALPTYYENTIYWEEADTIKLFDHLADLSIVSQFIPDPSQGNGVIAGFLEEPEEGGRGQANKRVSKAGVSARRVATTGRTKEDEILAAYVFTDDNGEFEMPDLPQGEYILNIQYPGYPMDTESDIRLEIGAALKSEVLVGALVENGKISVRKINVTNVYAVENYHADVFPNPAANDVTIAFASTQSERKIAVTDLSGSTLMNIDASAPSHVINISSLKRGIYLVQIKEKGLIVKTVKLSIQ